MSQPVPVMFIHGFDGSPAGWELFRQAFIARGADPELLWTFHYGWLEEGEQETEKPLVPARPSLATRLGVLHREAAELRERVEKQERRYNNRDDIRKIASRLVRRESADPDRLRSQLKRLSEASVQRGGPEKVSIIAHSMGGLVARYYLSRRTPDEWGTVNEGVVGRLVTIATPHLGVELASITHLIPPDALIWTVLRWLQKLPFIKGHPVEELAQIEAEVAALQTRVLANEMPVTAQGYLDSAALAQMVPGSDFLAVLNQPDAMPRDVSYALVWGDIRFTVSVHWGRLTLWERTVSFGDLLVRAYSASRLPGVAASHFPFIWGRAFDVHVSDQILTPYNFSDYLPPVSHSNLLLNEEVQATVIQLLGL